MLRHDQARLSGTDRSLRALASHLSELSCPATRKSGGWIRLVFGHDARRWDFVSAFWRQEALACRYGYGAGPCSEIASRTTARSQECVSDLLFQQPAAREAPAMT